MARACGGCRRAGSRRVAAGPGAGGHPAGGLAAAGHRRVPSTPALARRRTWARATLPARVAAWARARLPARTAAWPRSGLAPDGGLGPGRRLRPRRRAASGGGPGPGGGPGLWWRRRRVVTGPRARDGVVGRRIGRGYDPPKRHIWSRAGAWFAAQRAIVTAGHQLPRDAAPRRLARLIPGERLPSPAGLDFAVLVTGLCAGLTRRRVRVPGQAEYPLADYVQLYIGRAAPDR